VGKEFVKSLRSGYVQFGNLNLLNPFSFSSYLICGFRKRRTLKENI